MKTTVPSDMGPLMESFYTDLHAMDVDDGDVILFPSYLVHEVRSDPTRTDMRLTFSFNIMEDID